MDLIDVYVKQIRSILEFAAPVWNSSLTASEVADIERVQKVFLHILLGNKYISYKSALSFCCLESLAERRMKLCTKFAKKALQNEKHSHWFVRNNKKVNTRSKPALLKMPRYRCERFRRSPIPYLTNLLNSL